MSYQKKYIKYKSKYLNLKANIHNNNLGKKSLLYGGGDNDILGSLNIDQLSDTPTINNFMLKGGQNYLNDATNMTVGNYNNDGLPEVLTSTPMSPEIYDAIHSKGTLDTKSDDVNTDDASSSSASSVSSASSASSESSESSESSQKGGSELSSHKYLHMQSKYESSSESSKSSMSDSDLSLSSDTLSSFSTINSKL